ncbi:hypothetical protein AB0K37_41410, partial [Actinomadura sp. NPDC049753]
MSDLLYGEIENDLRASVREVLGDLAPWASVLAGTEKNEPYDAPLWRALAVQLGCASRSRAAGSTPAPPATPRGPGTGRRPSRPARTG